jgi:hypothetical protein
MKMIIFSNSNEEMIIFSNCYEGAIVKIVTLDETTENILIKRGMKWEIH